jgi:uncharacterized lipoprotein YajG
MRILTSLIAVSLLSGCGLRSFQKQTVLLAPQVGVAGGTFGQNRMIYLTVVDERTTTVLGHRAAGGGAQGAIITAEPDPIAAVLEALKKGLESEGFRVTQTSQTGIPKLEIQLRALEYRAAESVFVLKVSVSAAAKAAVTKGQEQIFQKMFSVSDEKSPFVAPGADWNAEEINSVLSSLLTQILHDQGLLDSLVQ